MKITEMAKFQTACKAKLVAKYNNRPNAHLITTKDVYVVWACCILGNFKALLSTNVSGDGVYVEYTYNKETGELYEDFYTKEPNTCYLK